jgi:DNA-binding transcriptional MerR regulator
MQLAVESIGRGSRSNGMIKIGAVANYFRVSVDLLRLYEREGLLIPLRSPRQTRYFKEQDFAWISTILRLVREARLNFAGIRHLLALLPCWQIQKCGHDRHACPVDRPSTIPCWASKSCCQNISLPEGCYTCPVYRAAPYCDNLKALLAANDANWGAPEGQHNSSTEDAVGELRIVQGRTLT